MRRVAAFVLAATGLACCELPLYGQQKDSPKFELKFKPAKLESGDSELVKLQKARFNAAIEMVELHLMRIETGRDSISAVGLAIDRVVRHGLELNSDAKDRLELLEEALRFTKHVEDVVNLQYNAGFVSKIDRVQIRYTRLNLEIGLLTEKERGKR